MLARTRLKSWGSLPQGQKGISASFRKDHRLISSHILFHHNNISAAPLRADRHLHARTAPVRHIPLKRVQRPILLSQLARVYPKRKISPSAPRPTLHFQLKTYQINNFEPIEVPHISFTQLDREVKKRRVFSHSHSTLKKNKLLKLYIERYNRSDRVVNAWQQQKTEGHFNEQSYCMMIEYYCRVRDYNGLQAHIRELENAQFKISVVTYETLWKSLFQMGHITEGLKYWEKSTRFSPSLGHVEIGLGLLRSAPGGTVAALQLWKYLRRADIKPSRTVFQCLLAIFNKDGNKDLVFQFARLMSLYGFSSDSLAQSALVQSFSEKQAGPNQLLEELSSTISQKVKNDTSNPLSDASFGDQSNSDATATNSLNSNEKLQQFDELIDRLSEQFPPPRESTVIQPPPASSSKTWVRAPKTGWPPERKPSTWLTHQNKFFSTFNLLKNKRSSASKRTAGCRTNSFYKTRGLTCTSFLQHAQKKSGYYRHFTTLDTKSRSLLPLVGRFDTSTVMDGDGVVISRSIGAKPAMVDPFLLLDEIDNEPGSEFNGFPDHPHRGFETITYILDGQMMHEDSKGNKGVLSRGSVQWMRAGRGLIHSEMPVDPYGRLHALQLWFNLPSFLKMSTPQYKDIHEGQLPTLENAQFAARVLSGEFFGLTGPIETYQSPLLVDLTLSPSQKILIPTCAFHSAFIYSLSGSVRIDHPWEDPTKSGSSDEKVGYKRSLLVFGKSGENGGLLELRCAGSDSARLIVGTGKPLEEDVARYGPFVMNTNEELQRAFAEFQAGVLDR